MTHTTIPQANGRATAAHDAAEAAARSARDRMRRVELENELYRILAKLPPGWPEDLVVVDIRVHGTRMVVRVGAPSSAGFVAPATAPPDALSRRARRVLKAVRVEVDRLGRRVLGREILEALHLAGYRIGRSTLNETLSDLVYRGQLVNPKDKIGYGFPGEHEEE